MGPHKFHLLEHWPCLAYCFRRFWVGRSCTWGGLGCFSVLSFGGLEKAEGKTASLPGRKQQQKDYDLNLLGRPKRLPKNYNWLLMGAEGLAEMQYYSLVLSDAFGYRLIWCDIVWCSHSLPCSLSSFFYKEHIVPCKDFSNQVPRILLISLKKKWVYIPGSSYIHSP